MVYSKVLNMKSGKLKVNKVKCWIVAFLIFLPCIILADTVNNEKVYSVQASKLYDLKVKLKPKVIESKIYWRGIRDVDWQKEVKNLDFGLLSKDKNICRNCSNIFLLTFLLRSEEHTSELQSH